MDTLKTGLANLESAMDDIILETENKVSSLEMAGDSSLSQQSSKVILEERESGLDNIFSPMDIYREAVVQTESNLKWLDYISA